MKIGIFGGSFNPPHVGHLNSLQTVFKKVGLDKVIVVPAEQSPLKTPTDGPSSQHRLEMTRIAVQSWGSQYEVSDLEIKRGGSSYTIDTLTEFKKLYPTDDLFLIFGADHFYQFENWKSPEKILDIASLIITSRPGFDLPTDEKDLPKFYQPMVEEMDFNYVELKSGKSIQFIRLNDVEASATHIRKLLRIGKSVEKYIPLGVETYIRENSLYQNLGSKIGDYGQFTKFCADVLFSKKGIQVRGFDLRQVSTSSDYSLVASGTSTRHASSLGENVIRAVKEEYNVFPQATEGLDEGRWVVLDYGSLIVHVFYDYVRMEYNLENLWRDAKDMGLVDPVKPAGLK